MFERLIINKQRCGCVYWTANGFDHVWACEDCLHGESLNKFTGIVANNELKLPLDLPFMDISSPS